MNLQFISDSSGKTTGVFIPINDWNELKIKYKGIEQDEVEIPVWQQKEVNNRIQLIENGEMKTRGWDAAKKEIFKQK